MTKKYFDGIVPPPSEREEIDADLENTVKHAADASRTLASEYHIADALDEIFSMLRRANKYIDETMPWALAKDETKRARLGTVLYNLLETIRQAAVLLTPYLPTTAEKIFAELGTDKKSYDTTSAFGALEAGRPLGEGGILFARLDEKEFLEKQEARRAAAKAEAEKTEEPAHEEPIGIEDFGKTELRVAEILTCEPVPKAKKLLKLTVDLGYEKRQIVSGIAKFYTPDDLIGKKVIVVANLKPAKLCGVDSYGMLLASGEEEIKVVFLDPAAKNGDRIH